MIGAILLQIILIALNAVFACAEIAVVSMSSARLRQLSDEGDRRAQRLGSLTAVPARFLATIQVAITLAGFLGSAYAADNFAVPLVSWLLRLGVPLRQSVLQSVCVFVITLIIAYFSIVFGELVPKRIAMHKTEPIALALAGLLSVVSVAFKPLVWLLTASTNGVLRLLHISAEEEDEVTEEEIRLMVSAGSERGVLAAGEGELIQNVFELDDISVEEICTHRVDVVGLYLEDSPEEWDRVIRGSSFSYYPVFGETMDDIEGVLSAKAYFRLSGAGREQVMAGAVKKPYLVPDWTRADTLLRSMQRTGNHFAVLIEEYGGLSGIVTLHDLIEVLLGDFPAPDGAPRRDEIARLDDHSWEIAGMAPLDEVSQAVGVPLPEDADYETFGGFLCAVLGEIPADGETLSLQTHGLQVDILQVDDHRIERTRVTRLDAPPDEAGAE